MLESPQDHAELQLSRRTQQLIDSAQRLSCNLVLRLSWRHLIRRGKAMNDYEPHWRFFRAGGFDQVCLDSAAELLAIGDLDQKL